MSRLRPLVAPRSVAVVGASPRPGSLAGAVFRNLVEGDFPGPLWAVHPAAQPVAGRPAFASVQDLPEAPELVITGIAAESTLETLIPLLDGGTRAVLVLSAGFREAGPEGRRREFELVRAVRDHGAVLLGPNTVGLHATVDGRRLDASFSRLRPRPAPVALITQSGSIGEWLLLRLHERGLGATFFAGLGNAADLDAVDMLHGVADLFPEVRQVLLYLETLPEAQRLREVCARLLPGVRLHVLLGGRSEAGEHAVGGHTGALASPTPLAEALFDSLGATLPTDLVEAVDILEASVRNPSPRGRRVAVVTNAGGPAILAVDALTAAGCTVPRFGRTLQTALAERSPVASGLGNPLDLLAPAGPGEFEAAIAGIGNAGETDALLAVFMHPVVTPGDAVAASLARSLGSLAAPRVVCWMGEEARAAEQRLREAGIAVFPDPGRAARALAGATIPGRAASPNPIPESADPTLFEGFTSRSGGWGNPAILEAWLSGDRIRIPECRRAATAAEALRAAAALGAPLVLKRESAAHPHKRRHGLLRFVDRDEALEAAVGALDLPDLRAPWLIQRRHPPGREIYLGFLRDPRLGSFLAIGRGGMAVEAAPPGWLALPADPDRLDGFVRRSPVAGSPQESGLLITLARRMALLASEHSGVDLAEVNPAIPDDGVLTLLDCRWKSAPPPGPPHPPSRFYREGSPLDSP